MASTKSLAISSAACLVHLAIDADHAAKGGDGIRRQGFLVGLNDRGSDGRAAGIAVLDDRHGGLLKLLDQLPGGVQIDQVVVAKFFALKLLCPGDAGARAVRIERRALVGILSITQVGRLGVGQQQRGREVGCLLDRFQPGVTARRSAAILLKVTAMAES